MASSVRSLAGLALVGWSLLAYGLVFSPYTQDETLHPEAGGRFALNVEVHGPFLLLSACLVAAWLAAAIWPNRGAAGMVAGAATLEVLFIVHVLRHDYVNTLLPDLALYAWVSLGTTLAVAVLSFVLAGRPEPVRDDAGSDVVAGKS